MPLSCSGFAQTGNPLSHNFAHVDSAGRRVAHLSRRAVACRLAGVGPRADAGSWLLTDRQLRRSRRGRSAITSRVIHLSHRKRKRVTFRSQLGPRVDSPSRRAQHHALADWIDMAAFAAIYWGDLQPRVNFETINRTGRWAAFSHQRALPSSGCAGKIMDAARGLAALGWLCPRRRCVSPIALLVWHSPGSVDNGTAIGSHTRARRRHNQDAENAGTWDAILTGRENNR